MNGFEHYHYFVEGKDEEKIINVLKTDLGYIRPGKVDVFNVVEKTFTISRFRPIKKGTAVVLVFDTDTDNISILVDNIKFLEEVESVAEILCITQVKNLEDELKRSCNIKQIKDLTGSKSNSDFKHDLLKISNLSKKLSDKKFDINKFWATNATGKYVEIENKAHMVKLETGSENDT